jgi:glycosyltransferase involved in cell wall biosynthesis
MRVLFVTRKYPPRLGGMESLSHGLTTGFPEPKTIIALGRSQKHLVWFLPYVIARLAFTAHRYDVVHLGDALLSGAGFVPRVIHRRKLAISVHGLDLTFPLRLYQLYLRLFLRADAFIANSESTRRLAEARGLRRVTAISIGVAERYFQVSKASHRDDELENKRAGRVALVTVGRLVRRKGAAWFVRHVLPKLHDVLYVVIGVGPERDAILRAAAEIGRSEDVWLVGGVTDARLLGLMGGCDVFVMPNIAVPGSGLPVVAARLEGIPDAVSDGDNGYLLPSEDAAAFASAIERLVGNAAERSEAGERGRAYTRASNSWPRIIEKYQALFQEITSP